MPSKMYAKEQPAEYYPMQKVKYVYRNGIKYIEDESLPFPNRNKKIKKGLQQKKMYNGKENFKRDKPRNCYFESGPFIEE